MMMRWEVFIIPLIALGVWILGTIFRNAEEERQKLGARRQPGGGRGPTRRPATDLERFLEDARRTRKQLEKRTQPEKQPPASRPPRPRRETPAPRPREVVIAVPVAEPLPQPSRARPAEMEPMPAAVFPQAPPVTAAPVRVVAEAVIVPSPSATTRVAEVAVAAAVPVAGRNRAAPTSRAQVIDLLRNPSTRAAALVLHEVLGPPLCRRIR
jgi:hypothetical protein